jgi:hypothetical protein
LGEVDDPGLTIRAPVGDVTEWRTVIFAFGKRTSRFGVVTGGVGGFATAGVGVFAVCGNLDAFGGFGVFDTGAGCTVLADP